MLDDLFLVSESTLNETDEKLGRLIDKVKHEYGIDVDDDLYGSAFRYYLLFDRWPTLLQGAVPELDATVRFYNKYYWFWRMKCLYFQKHGYDAGLDQQAFQLLEYAHEHETFDIDLLVTHQIEKRVEREVEPPRSQS